MTRFPISGERAGQRRLAVGGVAVTSAYRQIRHHLATTLGAEHAELFAEPVESGNTSDWYTDLVGVPVRLVDHDGTARATHAARLGEIVGRLDVQTSTLRAAKEDYSQHLARLLELAVQIPDEANVWIVGDQPVLTFWGHTRELGEPARSPLYDLLPRIPEVPQIKAEPDGEDGGDPGIDEDDKFVKPVETVHDRQERTVFLLERQVEEGRFRTWHLLLWALLVVQAGGIGYLLLSACSINLPLLPAISFCSNATMAAEAAGLEAERDRLAADIAGKRNACIATETLGPALDAKSIAGCWNTGTGVVKMVTKDDYGKITSSTDVNVEYCFGENGESGHVLYYNKFGYHCRGDMKVTRENETLRFDYEKISCQDSDRTVSGGFWICRSSDTGGSVCAHTNLLKNGNIDPDPGPTSAFSRVSSATP